jgi:hypothetical protein
MRFTGAERRNNAGVVGGATEHCSLGAVEQSNAKGTPRYATIARADEDVPAKMRSRRVKKLKLRKGGSFPTFLVLDGCCTTSLPWTLE